MVDIQTIYEPFKGNVKYLKIAYKFKNMPYLVVDRFGNFFVLPHFNKRRMTNFKQLKSINGFIYYNSNKVRLSTLRKRAIKQDHQRVKL